MSREEKPWEIHEVEYVRSATRAGDRPPEPYPQVAFAGRSNVGKSALLNMLARRKNLARTSRTPGLTQMVNYFRVNQRWFYVDLPGYGYAEAPRESRAGWQSLIEDYLVHNPRLRLVVMLMDARREPSMLDDELAEFLNHHRIPMCIALTKCDKVSKRDLARACRVVAGHFSLVCEPIATSATKGMGREELLRLLWEALEGDGQA